MAKPKTEFSIDQKVVYPSQGVGKVTDIFKKEFNGNEVFYYKIYVESSDTWVLVPVENAEKVGIRAIVSAEEAQTALDSISNEFIPTTSDWKLRYQMNLDLLRKGSIADIASIVRSLYHRSKIKELPILERKLYDSARKLLEDEIAEALHDSVESIVVCVKSVLEKTPPELAADVMDHGIVLTGGGSMLYGLADLIRKETNIPAMLADDPLSCVAIGTGKAIEFSKKL